MKRRWLIAGGGFRGIVAAHVLARAGCDVQLVEKAPFVGGVLHSESWDGLFLDKGCHLLDNSSPATGELLREILGDAVLPVNVRYASRIVDTRSDGIAVPDFTTCPDDVRTRILAEVVAAAAARRTGRAASLASALERRYGPTAAGILAKGVRKMFCVDAATLEPETLQSTPMSRVRVAPDAESLELKRSSRALDERLAVPSQDDPFRFYPAAGNTFEHRNIYPAANGMRGFCDAAGVHLERLGVDVQLGRGIASAAPAGGRVALTFDDGETATVDGLYWTLDMESLSRTLFGENELAGLVHKVPMVVMYFVAHPRQIAEYTYIHDFSDATRLFRMSSMGLYGRQFTPAGESFVSMEMPTAIGTDLWESPDDFADAIWQEAVALGGVCGDTPARRKVLKAPVSYKGALHGYAAVCKTLSERVNGLDADIRFSNPMTFSKKDIVAEVQGELAAAM